MRSGHLSWKLRTASVWEKAGSVKMHNALDGLVVHDVCLVAFLKFAISIPIEPSARCHTIKAAKMNCRNYLLCGLNVCLSV
jgi:hypothetical protein